jgi:hypothetical protein
MQREMSRTHVYRLTTFVAGFAALSTIGCGGGSKPPAMQMASAAVTPEAGGTVKLADNSVKLDVPPGAVDGNKTITMTTTDATAPQGITADSPILQFEPSGTVFQKPVTVTFTFKNATDPVVFWSNSTGGYDMIEGTVTGNSIAAPVMHFSTGFVGDRPIGSTATCGQGVACTAGMTCGYGTAPLTGTGGGGTSSGGSHTGSSGGSNAAADASAPLTTTDPGSGPTRAALSSTDPGSAGSSAAICCNCGADGTFQCSTCSGSNTSAPCVEGGACTAGSTCGMGSTSGGGGPVGSGGGTTTGGNMGGAADASAPLTTTDPGSGPTRAALSSTDPATGGTCCTCGTDGLYHCGGTCMPPSAGHDGGTITGGNGGGSDGGTFGGGGPTGLCMQGETCQAGGAPCANASVGGACSMCSCGANGTLECVPCDHNPGTGGNTGTGGSMGGGGGVCVPGGTCAAGAPDCENGAQGAACQICQCDPTAGMYKCSPCAGAVDGGTPPPAGDGGAKVPGCNPGAQCNPGDNCGNGAQGGACYSCQCSVNGFYQCSPCGGAADGGAGGTGAGGAGGGGTISPDLCMQGGKCPQPGAACQGLSVNGVCPRCMCSVDGILICQQGACQ